jgi:hypothetical protein
MEFQKIKIPNRETAVSLLQIAIKAPIIWMSKKQFTFFLRRIFLRIVIKNVVKCRKKVANIGFL